MIGEYILIFSAIFLTSSYFLGKWNGRKKLAHQHPPSLPCLPIVGSLPFIRNFAHMPKFLTEKSFELGPIFTFQAGSKLVLMLNSKDVIEEALVRNSRSFSLRPDIFIQRVGNPKHKGLVFTKKMSEFKRIHQTTLSILKEFGFGDKNIIEDRILGEVEAMVEYARKKEGKPFDPKDLSMLMTSNIIMNIMFGSRRDYDLGISELMHESDRYAHYLDMIFDIIPVLKYIPPFTNSIRNMKECIRTMYDIIETEIDKTLESNQTCFVSEYIKREGSNYDREHLNFLLRDVVAAGIDTTSTTFRWALIVLANRPKIQTRLQKDIDSVIPRDRFPALKDQTKLPYVEATILELFRWRSLAPLSVAHFVETNSVVKGFFIPAGTLVFPNLYAVHNHPDVWKDPGVFRPERFLDKDGNVVGKDRIVPFSLGRRSCPGEILARSEIFLFLTTHLQRFTTLPPEGQDKICDQPVLPISILLGPKAFSVRLLERQ